MAWTTNARPPKPQRGTFKKGAATGVPKTKRGRKGASSAASGGKSISYCESQRSWSAKERKRTGAQRLCDAVPLAKARPAAPQKSSVTSSNFRAAQSGKNKGKIKGVCDRIDVGSCNAQIGYRDGRRVLRFCFAKGKPGHVVDIHGKSPAEVYELSRAACASWRKKGSYVGTPVGKAALGGLRPRTKGRKKRR